MKSNSSTERQVRFITVEGGEGAGKTTLINAIEGMLTRNGIPVVRYS